MCSSIRKPAWELEPPSTAIAMTVWSSHEDSTRSRRSSRKAHEMRCRTRLSISSSWRLPDALAMSSWNSMISAGNSSIRCSRAAFFPRSTTPTKAAACSPPRASAANRVARTSRPRRTCISSMLSRNDVSETRAPLNCIRVTKPSLSSRRRASRTGTRETWCSLAITSSGSRSPALSRPDMMSWRIASAIRSRRGTRLPSVVTHLTIGAISTGGGDRRVAGTATATLRAALPCSY